jgi:phosphopantetheinyl transferase
VERVELFGLEPSVGQRLEAFVRIRRLEPGGIWADMELADAGAVAIRVTGWHDRRFEFDDRLWPVLRGPERHLLSTIRPEGYSLFHDTYRSAFTRDYLSRRFLGEQERAALDAVGPRRRRSWMAGRVAAKDAVRALLWRRGCGPVFPVEIAVWNEPGGRPRVRAPFLDDVRLSIAHTGELAVALASEGRDVGIDVERVEARPPEFWDVCFTAGERRAIEATEDPIAEATRLFAAKEAVAKSRGEGLGGNPRRLEMTDRDGGALEVGGRRVESRREGDCVVCWTVA